MDVKMPSMEEMDEWEKREEETEFKHEGTLVRRLNEDCVGLERVFAERWAHEQDSNLLRDLISYGDLKLTQRDATVAATVIQWLGSNVGRSFLREVVLDYKLRMKSCAVAEVLAETRFDDPTWYKG